MRQNFKARSRTSRSGDKPFSRRFLLGKRFVSSRAKQWPASYLTNYKLKCPLGAAIFSARAWNEIARSLKLSKRELQIVQKVFDDRTELAIADDLGVSPHTIHTHCERLYHKLTVTGRVKLVLRIADEFLALTLAPGSTLPPICMNRAAGRCPLRLEGN